MDNANLYGLIEQRMPADRSAMAEVDVQLAAARRRISLRHVLLQHVGRFGAGDQNRAEVADQRLDDVTLFEVERVRRRDRLALLPEGAVQTADHLRLPEERDDPLLQRPRQAEVVVDLEKLFVRQHVPRAACRVPRAVCPGRGTRHTALFY